MHAYTTSISMVWLINTPILGVGLILSMSIPPSVIEGFWMLMINAL